MSHMSVQDQFCDVRDGNWHQTVFLGTTECKKSWWNKPMDLTFTTDSCVGGYKLKSCSFTTCEELLHDDEEEATPPMVGPIVKVKTMLREPATMQQ